MSLPLFFAWLDPYWLFAIAIGRVVINPVMSRKISVALSLECFFFFHCFITANIYYDVRLKGRRETGVSPLVANLFFFKYSLDPKLTSVIKAVSINQQAYFLLNSRMQLLFLKDLLKTQGINLTTEKASSGHWVKWHVILKSIIIAQSVKCGPVV